MDVIEDPQQSLANYVMYLAQEKIENTISNTRAQATTAQIALDQSFREALYGQESELFMSVVDGNLIYHMIISGEQTTTFAKMYCQIYKVQFPTKKDPTNAWYYDTFIPLLEEQIDAYTIPIHMNGANPWLNTPFQIDITLLLELNLVDRNRVLKQVQTFVEARESYDLPTFEEEFYEVLLNPKHRP